MDYRNLGRSDLVTSVIGFGGFPMGRGQYGPFDDDEVVRAVHRAIDLGVTLFDTAAGYGSGEGERLLGKALVGRRDQVVLASKGGASREKARERPRREPAAPADRLPGRLHDPLARRERADG